MLLKRCQVADQLLIVQLLQAVLKILHLDNGERASLLEALQRMCAIVVIRPHQRIAQSQEREDSQLGFQAQQIVIRVQGQTVTFQVRHKEIANPQ